MRAHFLSSEFVDADEFNRFADHITNEHADSKVINSVNPIT